MAIVVACFGCNPLYGGVPAGQETSSVDRRYFGAVKVLVISDKLRLNPIVFAIKTGPNMFGAGLDAFNVI